MLDFSGHSYKRVPKRQLSAAQPAKPAADAREEKLNGVKIINGSDEFKAKLAAAPPSAFMMLGGLRQLGR